MVIALEKINSTSHALNRSSASPPLRRGAHTLSAQNTIRGCNTKQKEKKITHAGGDPHTHTAQPHQRGGPREETTLLQVRGQTQPRHRTRHCLRKPRPLLNPTPTTNTLPPHPGGRAPKTSLAVHIPNMFCSPRCPLPPPPPRTSRGPAPHRGREDGLSARPPRPTCPGSPGRSRASAASPPAAGSAPSPAGSCRSRGARGAGALGRGSPPALVEAEGDNRGGGKNVL